MKKLVIYLVCEPETPELAAAAVEGGADLIELGIPFSDPLAEGPTIRLASERALARGMRTAECIDCIAKTRALVDVPLVPMTYAAILEAHGYDRYLAETRAAGATSSIGVSTYLRPRPARNLSTPGSWLASLKSGTARSGTSSRLARQARKQVPLLPVRDCTTGFTAAPPTGTPMHR